MLYLCDKAEKYFKFHTSYLINRLLGSELPEPIHLYPGDLPGIVVGGWFRRFMESQKVDRELKLSLALGLQNVKRAAISISEDQQDNYLIDHKKNMVGGAYEGHGLEEHLTEVREKVVAITEYYYTGEIAQEVPIWRVPSTRSCFQHSASQGGTSHYFADVGHGQTTDGWDENFHQFGWLRYENETIPLYSQGFSLDDLDAHIASKVDLRSHCRAEVHKVLEPFKCRVITAGDAPIYQAARSLQPVFHSRLRDDTCFQFIGKRHNVEDVEHRYTGCNLVLDEKIFDLRRGSGFKNALHDRQFFVAGDFKNATDAMHPSLPKAFIDTLAIVSDLSAMQLRVCRLTLGPHKLFYPDGDVVMQTWGQLMGSPLSFPVLNIVNAAVLWASAEQYYDQVLSWERVQSLFRPLINGDDISFLSNKVHYELWKSYAKAAGMSPSIGKNYTTHEFVNINSTTYMCNMLPTDQVGISKVGHFHELFVLNPGLVKGQAKVLDDTRLTDCRARKLSPQQMKEKKMRDALQQTNVMPYCDQLKEVIRVAPEQCLPRINAIFYNHIQDDLKNSKRSWSLPTFLGGLGLPFGTVSYGQRLVAMKVKEKYIDLSETKSPEIHQLLGQEYFSTICDNLGITKIPSRIGIPPIGPVRRKDQLFDEPNLSHLFLSQGHNDPRVLAYNGLYTIEDQEKAMKESKRLSLIYSSVDRKYEQYLRRVVKEHARECKALCSHGFTHICSDPFEPLQLDKLCLIQGGYDSEIIVCKSKNFYV